jgi:hypothetical protein
MEHYAIDTVCHANSKRKEFAQACRSLALDAQTESLRKILEEIAWARNEPFVVATKSKTLGRSKALNFLKAICSETPEKD